MATLMIEKIETNNGLAEVRLGEIQIIESYDIVLHIINPEEIKNVITALESNLIDLNLEDEKGVLTTELNSLKHMIQTLIPYRHKRGLINLVGTGFKWLYGTMDDNDRQNIEEHLKTIDENNHNIINQSNRQVYVNDHFNKTFLTLKQTIENDRKKIINQLNSINQGNKHVISKILYLESILKIKIIKDNLEHIQNNIASSRIGLMGNNILTNEEIDKYNIDLEKFQNIKLGTFKYDECKIIFAIKIPKSTFKAKLYLITAMPNQNSEELLIEDQTIVRINNTRYKYVNDPDFKTLKEFNLCNNCVKSKNVKFELKEIEKGLLLLKNCINVSLNSNCDERNSKLNGNYLLTFSNCEVYVNNRTFTNKQEKFVQRFVIPNDIRLHVNRSELTFDDLIIKQAENIEFIKELKYQRQNHLYIDIGTGLIIVAIFLIISIYVYRKFRVTYKIRENFHLKEGNVTSIMSSPIEQNHGSITFPIDWRR